MLPLSGKCSVTIGKKKILWGAGLAGMFLPEYDGRILGTGDTRTFVMLRLDAKVLTRTAQAMTGRPEAQIDLRIDQGRAVALQLFGRALGPILLQKGRMLDLQDCDKTALMMQGYDDWFNRLAVAVLCPDLFGQAESSKAPELTNRIRVVNSLCDEMLADLEIKHTLTMLEQKSGYSARALQYAFKERFGCGPMEWLREQRLLRAQQRLVCGDFETISQLAHELGFGGASQFSTAYKQRFGNSPSTYL
jgi:AraC-like DNA-binding protein